MLFNSHVFLFCFLPVTFILFRFACAFRLTDVALAVLMVMSLFFYSYWNPPFVFLILFSILFNYTWGRLIERSPEKGKIKRFWLYSGVGLNLALIAYFKYANFFMGNLSSLVGAEWTARDIFLPLGISFFTFQQIAYLIDCSRGLAKEHAFTHYALFVTFFPQLIAGPIVRYEEIMPQFSRLRTFGLSYRNIAMGVTLIAFGLFKKLVIADTLSPWVAAVFDSSAPLTFFEAWGGALCYTFQIYFDFSGYSDMALGLGRLFNIVLPVNFNSPYKALSISDFWRRWHISLSTFLRDYLYIPLGGSRKGKGRRYLNLMITMLLGGLWHGASWTFVAWGGVLGVFLCINHSFKALFSSYTPPRIWRLVAWVLTFFSVVLSWVFFRSVTFSRAGEVFIGMAGMNGVILPPHYIPWPWLADLLTGFGVELKIASSWALIGGKKEILMLAACMVGVVALPNSYEWASAHFLEKRISIPAAAAVGGVLAMGILFLDRISEFLYFQF